MKCTNDENWRDFAKNFKICDGVTYYIVLFFLQLIIGYLALIFELNLHNYEKNLKLADFFFNKKYPS
jgi:hypothetical protein